MFSQATSDQVNAIRESWMALDSHANSLQVAGLARGGMHWKKINGREYLYKTTDGTGNAASLGLRSAKTEAIHAEFVEKKASAARQTRQATVRLLLQSKFNHTLKVGRLPNAVLKVCQDLSASGGVPNDVVQIGLICLHAYEVLFGVHFNASVLKSVEHSPDMAALLRMAAEPRSAHLVIGKNGKFCTVQIPGPKAFLAYKMACATDKNRPQSERDVDLLVAKALTALIKKAEAPTA